MKYAVITFGCRVNQADSIGLEEDFLARGGQPSAPEKADVVVVNTCSVTASADQAARQSIRRINRINPAAKIIVTGCYATRRPGDVADLPNVIRVIANDSKTQLVPLVGRYLPTAERFGDGDGSCGATIEPGVAGRTAFTLRVQTGCAESCSYCIIPATRGEPRSVPVAEVLREIERVTAAGFKEIALTGVHLGSYGRDLAPRSSLIHLLRAIVGRSEDRSLPESNDVGRARLDDVAAARLSDVGRARPSGRANDILFRISSLEPMDCSSEIVDLVAGSPALAPHFHLPLQHASDRVLRAMCRPYTLGDYSLLVDDIRARLPHSSIGSDIIVGFPGETDRDFEVLASYLESSPLTHLHVFPYSERPGTAAAALPDRVHGTVVRERAERLRKLSETLARRFRGAQIGTRHRALTIDDGSVAVTENYLKIRIPPGRQRNEWIDVRLTSHHDGELLCG